MINKYNNPRLTNTTLSGTGLKHPVRPHVILGDPEKGYLQGDLVDANGVLDLIDAADLSSNARVDDLEDRVDGIEESIPSQIDQAISDVVGAAPETLDTLNELAQALNDDENFASTISTQLSAKANSADLATVATSGSYSDLSNTPNLATVATTGSYSDLTDKPTIPTVPTNVSAFTNDAGYLTQHQDISGKANSADLATVATTGSYTDLSNKPTIPAAQVQANWNETNSSSKAYIKNKPTIPTVQQTHSDKIYAYQNMSLTGYELTLPIITSGDTYRYKVATSTMSGEIDKDLVIKLGGSSIGYNSVVELYIPNNKHDITFEKNGADTTLDDIYYRNPIDFSKGDISYVKITRSPSYNGSSENYLIVEGFALETTRRSSDDSGSGNNKTAIAGIDEFTALGYHSYYPSDVIIITDTPWGNLFGEINSNGELSFYKVDSTGQHTSSTNASEIHFITVSDDATLGVSSIVLSQLAPSDIQSEIIDPLKANYNGMSTITLSSSIVTIGPDATGTAISQYGNSSELMRWASVSTSTSGEDAYWRDVVGTIPALNPMFTTPCKILTNSSGEVVLFTDHGGSTFIKGANDQLGFGGDSSSYTDSINSYGSHNYNSTSSYDSATSTSTDTVVIGSTTYTITTVSAQSVPAITISPTVNNWPN